VFLAIAALLISVPASAQHLEVAGLTAFNTTAILDRTSEGIDELAIADGWTWGAHAAYFITERFGLEGLWTYQVTSLDMTAGTYTAEVFEMTMNQVIGNVVYHLGAAGSRIKPFIFGGLGATFFSSDDLDSESHFAWDVGAGVKWFFQQRLGIEGRFRYRPTELRDTASESCGPFGFCQATLKSVDIAAGVVVRF
jgi:outer membrane protein W